MKYTKEDIIIWADDPRLEGAIGKECWFGKNPDVCLWRATENMATRRLEEIRPTKIAHFTIEPFEVGAEPYHYNFIILKRESKKVVPFDFSLKEDRDALIGRRITCNSDNRGCLDILITGFAGHPDIPDSWLEWGSSYNSQTLLDEGWVFADGENKGKPVGKEVEG